MSITSVVNDTVTSVSVVNALKPLPPTITNYSVGGLDDTALDPAGGQTVQINGTGFLAGATITFDGSAVAVVTYVNPNRLTFTSPAKSAGTYTIYVVNPDGGTAIFIPGIIYSLLPTWTTGAGTLGSYYETQSISNTVVASGDAPITYSLFSGALPTGATLAANGVITGTAPVDSSSTTYSFTIEAIDAQLQGSTRSFSLTINTDVVTWVSPANGTTYTSAVDSAIANVTLSATDAAGYAVSYSANALPTGLSISGANISGTPTVIADSSTLLTATAATTNRTATRTINWSITVANDPYFEYNTLLIPGASTTFVDDASTNNFAVTINGDTRPNSFNPYSPGYYSNFLDGTGDYLTVPANAAFGFGTGDFTIETWTYVTQIPTTAYVFDMRFGGGDLTALILNTTGTYTVYVNGETASATPATSILNRWVHWAIVRSSGTVRVYINGIQSTTFTASGSIITSGLAIGARTNLVETLSGYLSNFRVVKGTAVYTSAFTPSTTPLTAIANTSLLTCQSNRFIDNSTNNFAITVAGNTTINSFDPFVLNSSYSTYGSGYFDGTGDYLNTPANAAFALGTGDFTLECWIYVTAAFGTSGSGRAAIISNRTAASGNTSFVLQHYNGNIYFGTVSTDIIIGTTTMSINRWYHVAITRSSGTVRLFLNGVSDATAVTGNTTNFSDTSAVYIGIDGSYSLYPYTGYITDARIVKGTAVYTTTFTPPSAPLTAIANTSLLTLQNNQSVNNNVFLDNSTNNFFVTRNGNTTQGTFSPYGGNWSNYFDGTGDYLTAPANTALAMGSGAFTMEAWVYNVGGFSTDPIFESRINFTSAGGYAFLINSSGYLNVYTNSAFVGQSSTALVSETWYHVALVRTGTGSNQTTYYINGVASGTITLSGNFTDASTVVTTIGGSTSAGENFGGYISNARIVKGTAVYTSAFTPPTTPLTPITNTSLLTCADNRLIDDSINNFTITKNGDVSVQRFSPFNPSSLTPTSYSGYFGTANGNGLYLSNITNGIALSGNYTIEFWLYPTGASGSGYSVITTANASAGIFQYYYNSAGKIGYYTVAAGAVLTSASVLTFNAWQHVALVRSSDVVKVYVNGVEQAWASSITDSTTVYANYISGIGSTYNIFGYASNFRVNTTAVYTTTFTPPTSPLTAISGTSLLTLQSPTFIDNSTNNFTITAVGNSQPTQQNPFGFTSATTNGYTVSTIGGSGYFDGTGDYLTIAGNSAFNFGTSNFTLECWVFQPDINAGTRMIAALTPYSTSNTGWGLYFGAGYIAWFVNGANRIVSSNPIAAGTWNHLAIVRSSSSTVMYINGVVAATAYSDSTNYSGTTQYIGSDATQNYSGYISDFRVVKGTAIYTSNFVPPSAPLTAVQNTVLLTNMTSAGIYDAAMMNNMETVGDAKLSTAVSKFGGSSMSFDGTGDGLFRPSSDLYNFGASNFTIEFWIYFNSKTGYQTIISSGYTPNTANGWVAQTGNGDGKIIFYRATGSSASVIVADTGSTVNTGQWYHIAIVRSASTTTIYRNGTSVGTGGDTNNYSASASLYIGGGSSVGFDNYFLNGYIDDLRVTKGYARYTSNFTPPTVAFPVY